MDDYDNWKLQPSSLDDDEYIKELNSDMEEEWAEMNADEARLERLEQQEEENKNIKPDNV
tara:strand:+ start:121 stop:300 length:180 start_codon:yes stop_codon:yes gene_type:complete